MKFNDDYDFGYFLFFDKLEQRSDLVGNQSGKWSSYEHVGRTGSAYPGTCVSVDEIRSAAAVPSSAGYYPPVHGALVGSSEPDPAGMFFSCLCLSFQL